MAKPTIAIKTTINSDVLSLLNQHCPPGTRSEFIESCLFLDTDFARICAAHGIKRPGRRVPGNPDFGPGYRRRWDVHATNQQFNEAFEEWFKHAVTQAISD